jgi:hypothetical protein
VAVASSRPAADSRGGPRRDSGRGGGDPPLRPALPVPGPRPQPGRGAPRRLHPERGRSC